MTETKVQKNLHHCQILVTPTSFGKDDQAIRKILEASVGKVIYNPTNRPLKSAELCSLIKDVHGFIAGIDEIDAAVIQAANKLRVIARYGVGVDRIDLEAATRRGIVVTNTPGANSVAVAELAIGFMLALARSLCIANRTTHRGEWLRYNGTGLRGKTAGLIGFGSIGREVAVRLKAFGCRILAMDPHISQALAEEYGVELVALDDLLVEADIVSLHVPFLPSTFQMVNEKFLEKMKPGAFLVNTARGELVDETALKVALENGRLRGAALDCFIQEPPPKDHPLLQLSQVILTPHSGSHTDDAVNQMSWMSLKDCLAVMRDEIPQHVVNPEVFAGLVHRKEVA